MASSPRTPSIRAVPYNHTDRLAHASWTAGSYSPSSWPFPKSAKSSSMDLSGTTVQFSNPNGGTLDATDDNADTQSDHSTTIRANPLPIDSTRDQEVSDGAHGDHARADVSCDSIVTQIYAPRRNNGSVSVARPRSDGAEGPFANSTLEIPERPITPTPYSISRKVSGTSRPRNSDGKANHQDDERLGSGRRSRHIQVHRSEDLAMPDHERNNTSVAGSVDGSNIDQSVATSRGEASPGLHPLFRLSVTNSVSRHVRDTGNNTEGGGQPGRRSADASAATSKPQGIVIMPPSGEIEAPMRSNSITSQRETTICEERAPDLESLRRGPRIRHARLPPSPSTAVNHNHSWKLPKSTREMWSIADRSWNMIIAFVVFLGLSILSFVSSVTATIMSHMQHGDPAVGTVVAAIVSGTFAMVFGVLVWISILYYRKMKEDLISGETWIEMHHRSRPLPARPGSSEENKQDNAAIQAWQKFAQDHEQLRRYVEYLESRVGVLEEGKSTDTHQGSEGPSAGATGSGSGGIGGVVNGVENRSSDDDGGSTPRARKLSVGGSLSRRGLLRSEDTATDTESWRDEGNNAIPRSDTGASILTELCAAVTEGYSPLAEEMPRGSSHMAQVSIHDTPSIRPRGSTSRYLSLPDKAVTHQRGFR